MKQNKNIVLFIVLAGLTGITGCKKFLETQSANRVSVSDIFKDFEGARTTIVGCYDKLKSSNYYFRDFYVYPELTGGNIKYARTTSPTLSNVYNFTNDGIDNEMASFYNQAYSTIYSANNILENIDNALDASPPQKNRMIADAYAIRAMAHFDLVRVFAQAYSYTPDGSHPGIIIKTKNTSVTAPVGAPNSVKEVYNQVIADFDSAIARYSKSISIYTNGNDKTWLNPDAVKALQSRVYLYKSDWAKVISLSSELINLNKYTLEPTGTYVASWSKKNISSESILELAFGNGNSGGYGTYFNPVSGSTFVQFASTTDLLSLYSSTDIRNQNNFFVPAFYNSKQYFFSRKYQGINDTSNNIKVIRASELYLNRAEAYAESSSANASYLSLALNDLNTIRKRADPSAAIFTSADSQVVIDSIFKERRKELCYEGHLFFDISRKKKNLVRIDALSSNANLTYPNDKYATPKPLIQ